MKTNFLSNLEEIKLLTLSGEYREALAKIDDLLILSPLNIQALRLKGNTLEILAFSQYESYAPDELKKHFLDARLCYETILSIEPSNTYALRDLADNLNTTGETTQAKELYLRLIEYLKHSISANEDVSEDTADELADAIACYSEIDKEVSI